MKTLKLGLLWILSIVMLAACETESAETDLFIEQSAELTSKLDENGKADHQSKLQNRVINSDALKGNFIGNPFTRKLQIYTPRDTKRMGLSSIL